MPPLAGLVVAHLLLGCTITPLRDTGVFEVPDTGRGDTADPVVIVGDDDGPCPAYSGFANAGQRWTYDVDDGAGTYGGEERELLEFWQDGDQYWIYEAVHGDFVADAVAIIVEETRTWRCDADGLWLRRVAGRQDDTFQDYTTSSWYEDRYGDNELLVLARNPGLGSRWTSSVRLNQWRDGGHDQYRFTAVAEVTDEASYTAPIGTFWGLEVERHGGPDDVVQWYARDVGLLGEGTRTLEAYSP